MTEPNETQAAPEAAGSDQNLFDMVNAFPKVAKAADETLAMLKAMKEDQDKKNSEFEKRLMELAGKKEEENEKKAKEDDKEKEMEKQEKPEKSKYPYPEKTKKKAEDEDKKNEVEMKKADEVAKSDNGLSQITDVVGKLAKTVETFISGKTEGEQVTKSVTAAPITGTPSEDTPKDFDAIEWAEKTAEEYPTPEAYGEAVRMVNLRDRYANAADQLVNVYGKDLFDNNGGLA